MADAGSIKRPADHDTEEEPAGKTCRNGTSIYHASPAHSPPRPITFACRYVAGPMVGASDLAFRLLCRRHGTDTCYTEMLFSDRLVSDEAYRMRKLQTCTADRPLVVQLQGNNPATVAAASALVERNCPCDAIDLNLGCPLPQAEAQCFGAYLLDKEHWPTLTAIITAMVNATSLPVTVKIRLLPNADDTLALCRLLAAAGCSLIAIHGRQRPPPLQHRGQRQSVAADLDAIRDVATAMGNGACILSNGNTEAPGDVGFNMKHTGAHGVMAAEGLLRNPLLFETPEHRVCAAAVESHDEPAEYATASLSKEALAAVALEYLALAESHPPEDVSIVRGHLMWMLGKSGKGHRCTFEHLGPYSAPQLRMALCDANSVGELEMIVRAALSC